jgi:hypothetical protein
VIFLHHRKRKIQMRLGEVVMNISYCSRIHVAECEMMMDEGGERRGGGVRGEEKDGNSQRFSTADHAQSCTMRM